LGMRLTCLSKSSAPFVKALMSNLVQRASEGNKQFHQLYKSIGIPEDFFEPTWLLKTKQNIASPPKKNYKTSLGW
jgi:hypothetical protein